MNREIKFRVWANNKFYYKCLIGNTNDIEDSNWTCPMVWLENTKEWVNCDNCIISQYTGLKDKNGVEIYEGDIVKNDEFTLEVVYNTKIQAFALYDRKKQFSIDEAEDLFYQCDDIEENFRYDDSVFEYKCGSYEVIGNIYENKELLEND